MYPGTDAETICRLAEGGNYLRVYKLANDYGDKVTHTNYYTCKDAGDERALFSSPLVHNVVLVYDHGQLVSRPVKFLETSEGRQIQGVDLLQEKNRMRDNKTFRVVSPLFFRYHPDWKQILQLVFREFSHHADKIKDQPKIQPFGDNSGKVTSICVTTVFQTNSAEEGQALSGALLSLCKRHGLQEDTN